jgi:hypothetical protein
LVDSIEVSGDRFEDGDEVTYGFWPLRFVSSGSGRLDVHEMGPGAETFISGVDRAAGYWLAQHEACAFAKAQFSPPSPFQLAAVDPGILSGGPARGERYPSPEHMSGWYLLQSAGERPEVASLRILHLHHVVLERPDLAAFLALPPGHRFRQPSEPSQPTRIWFDAKLIDAGLEAMDPP